MNVQLESDNVDTSLIKMRLYVSFNYRDYTALKKSLMF